MGPRHPPGRVRAARDRRGGHRFLLEAGGHIGYGVRPSARRRGRATWALARVLLEAKALGLHEVLVTCDDTNTGSQQVIEGNGGVMEDIRDTSLGRTRRYWISVG